MGHTDRPAETDESPATGPTHSNGQWDCRLCTRPNQKEEICGYCGNPKDANASLPPLPRKRRCRRSAARVRPYARRLRAALTPPDGPGCSCCPWGHRIADAYRGARPAHPVRTADRTRPGCPGCYRLIGRAGRYRSRQGRQGC
ncbi:hypothetical protein GCM10027570_32160 [Streptomonospora sediminis]